MGHGHSCQFATKGFVVDAERLKRADAFDRIAELRDIIRGIDMPPGETMPHRFNWKLLSLTSERLGCSEVE
jgi:hypothetical protein